MSDQLSATPGEPVSPLGHMDALPAGTMLGEFEVQGLLGVGGFGMVYRGYDHSLQRQVAIKEYMPAALVGRVNQLQVVAKSALDANPFQAGLVSFIAEARLLARFDHPSLVKVYRFWEANGTAYMAMPLYRGITLKQARSLMSGPPPEDWMRPVLWSVLEALKILHGSNTLHRDVSPDNVFLQDEGPPVLLDLGAARRAIAEGNQKHTAILKVNYAPIEQYADAEDLREGAWTDLYAVAAVVHGCLSNEAPTPATVRVVKDRLPPFSKIADTARRHFNTPYSSGFVKAIDHALMLEPSARPQSVEAFAQEMRLRAPRNMLQFDWRAALAGQVQLSNDPRFQNQPQTEPITAGHERTQVYIPLVEAPASDLAPPRQPKPKAPEVKKNTLSVPASVPRSVEWRVGLGVLLILLLAALAWDYLERHAAPPPLPVSAVVALPNVAKAESPAVAASVPSVQLALPDESSPVVAPKIVKPIAVVRPLAARVSSSAPDVTVRRESAPTAESTGKVGPSTPVEAPVKQSSQSAPLAAAPQKDLCPDSNFFTRPMCIYQECQKTENTRLAVCIEDKKRWENRDKGTQP